MDNYYSPTDIPFGQFSEDFQNEEYSNIEGNNLMSCENAINIDSCMMEDDRAFNDIIRYFEGDNNLNSDFDEILKTDLKKEEPISNNNIDVNGFDSNLDNMNNLCNNFKFNENSFDTNLNQFSDFSELNYSPQTTPSISSIVKSEETTEEYVASTPGPMRPRRNTTKRKNQHSDYIYDDVGVSTPKLNPPTKRTRVAVLKTPSTRSYVPVPQEERDDIWLEKRKRNNEAVVKSRNKKKEKLDAEHRELEELRVKSKEDSQKIKALENKLNQSKLRISDMEKEICQLENDNANLKTQLTHYQNVYRNHNTRILVSQRPSNQTRGRMELYPPQHGNSYRRG